MVKISRPKSGAITSENLYVAYNWHRWAGSILPIYRAELLRTKMGILAGYIYRQPKIRTVILTVRIEDCFQEPIIFLETFKQEGVDSDTGFRLAELRAAWWTGKNSPVGDSGRYAERNPDCPQHESVKCLFPDCGLIGCSGAPKGRTVPESEDRVNNTGACQSCHISPRIYGTDADEYCPGCYSALLYESESGLIVCKNPDCSESKGGGGWTPLPR